MVEVIRREAVYLWYYFDLQLRQILPYFLLGIVLGSVISVFVKDRIHGLFRSLGDKKLGVLLSALFQRYVPAEFVSRLFGKGNEAFGVLMAATIGVPLYACGGGTIPLLIQWISDGMSIDAYESNQGDVWGADVYFVITKNVD